MLCVTKCLVEIELAVAQVILGSRNRASTQMKATHVKNESAFARTASDGRGDGNLMDVVGFRVGARWVRIHG